MPTLYTNGAQLHYDIHGDGPETILFSHGLLWSGLMFQPQVEALKSRYRVITYDHRGQGRSQVAPDGYDMDNLYLDAVGLMEQLGLGPCHLAGLSMGGFVAMRVAARRPELVKSLILMETSADPEPNKFKYSLLNGMVRLFGVKSVSSQVMPIMFGHTFLTDPARARERDTWRGHLEANPKTIVRAVEGVISRQGIFEEIAGIQAPTLVIVGEEDVATVPAKAQRIHQQIKGSQLTVIPNGGHTITIEQPEAVNQAILKFLDGLG